MSKKNHRPVILTTKKEAPQVSQAAHEVSQEELPPATSSSFDVKASSQKKDPRMTKAAIVSNGAVRHVVQVIQNGTRMSAHAHVNFNAHALLLNKLRKAFELPDRAQAEEQFLSVLQEYLEAAVTHLPNAGRKEDIPEIIILLKMLIGEHEEDDGFFQLGRYILSAANAPVDRF